MNIIDDTYIEIKRNRILGRIGSIKNKDDSRLNNLIDECIIKSRELIQPLVIFETLPILEKKNEAISIEGNLNIRSKTIYDFMHNSSFLTIYICSINNLLENYIANIYNEPLKQLIMDSIGSEATEELANNMNRKVYQLANSKGYSLTLRRSPGFGDFDLKFQKEIVNLLDSSKFGITLNEHNFLLPRKSTSGIIGWEKRI